VAFSELELKRIDRLVGGLCRRRTACGRAEQLQLLYEISPESVVLFEERPDWRDSAKRLRSPVARLQYAHVTGLWTLYWQRADLAWHRYQPSPPSVDLAALVAVVERDEYGAFFG
jgi:hypothetical protein